MTRLKHPKKKGNKHELEMAKIMGTVLYNDSKSLSRSPTSGATLWKGDIVPNKEKRGDFFARTRPAIDKHPAGEWPLVIECKHDQQVYIEPFLVSHGGFLNQVWNKTRKEAQESNAFPILLVKNNRGITFFITDSDCIDYLRIDWEGKSGELPDFWAFTNKHDEDVYILPLEFVRLNYKGILL